MKLLITALTSVLLSTNVQASDKYYRSNTDDWLLSYDISQDIADAPVDWSEYEKHEAKWRRKYTSTDGKKSSLDASVDHSPGCIREKGGEHWKVYLLKYKNPKSNDRVAVKWRQITTYSYSDKGKADGNRKSSQKNVNFYCGIIGEAHGITMPNF